MTDHLARQQAEARFRSPPPSATPTATYADDGGYQFKQKAYAEAAAGKPQLLEQTCRANAPPGWSG